jgi:hypothetical protein
MSNAQIATLAVGLPSSSRQASPFLGQFDGFGSGLPVAAILYYLFTLSLDVAAETRIAEAEAAELETGTR